MVIHELDFEQVSKTGIDSVFTEISERKSGGYLFRNFFDETSLKKLKSVFEKYPHPYFQPYEGFDSLPRPFNFIFKTNQDDWKRECDYIFQNLEKQGLQEVFREKIKKISGDTQLIFSSADEKNTFSNSWAALRRLAPDKGMFEVHCGRLFQDANKPFYNFFRQKADVDIQMTFLMVVDKPQQSVSDIDIYNAHWEEIGEKTDPDTLKDRKGNLLPLSSIECHRVQLKQGDILIFDEGNYWHAVPEFSGEISRLSLIHI